jgi:hypothetical protein
VAERQVVEGAIVEGVQDEGSKLFGHEQCLDEAVDVAGVPEVLQAHVAFGALQERMIDWALLLLGVGSLCIVVFEDIFVHFIVQMSRPWLVVVK